jgi:hypothetical protein
MEEREWFEEGEEVGWREGGREGGKEGRRALHGPRRRRGQWFCS